MKLIKNANKFWRMYSVWVFGIIGFAAIAQEEWPTISVLVPVDWQPKIIAALAVIGILSRVIKQDSVQKE